jgi:hypothetical protein
MGARFLTWARTAPLVREPHAPVVAQRVVLLLLADNADRNGIAWPSVARMAETAGLSRSTVKYAITALIDAGLIVPEVGRSRGGPGNTTRWRLLQPPALRAVASNGDGTEPAAPRPVTELPTGRSNRPQQPAAVRPRTRSRNPQL